MRPTLLLPALLVAAPLSAGAQDEAVLTTTDSIASTDEADVAARDLAPIVVTTEKIGRSRLDSYASVSVVTEEALETFGIQDVRDVLRLTPNANFAPTQRGNNGFVLRGINSEGVTGPTNVTRPLASFILDGVAQSFEGARRGARGIYDVQQVEVARGPQSTLQGRNALAGALIVRTNDPSFAWEASGQIGFGQLGYSEQAAMVSGPVGSDTTPSAFRVALQRFTGDKDFDIRTPGLDTSIDEDEFESTRLKYLFAPADSDVSVLVSHAYVNDQPSQTGVQGPDFFAREIFVPLTSYEFRDNTVNNSAIDVDWAIGDGWRLRSISSFTETDARIRTPEVSPLFRTESRIDDDWQQDLRAEYQSADGRSSAIIGAYYARLDNDRDSLVSIPQNDVIIQSLTSQTQLRNYAVFGEVRLPFNSWLSGIAGLRYDNETYEINFLDRTEDVPMVASSETDYDVWLPKFGLAAALAADHRLALTFSRGYRGGFVEQRTTTGDRFTVEPEFLNAYELAYRGQWTSSWFTSANLFYYDWTDQQVSVIDPNDPLGLLTLTDNAGESSSRGVEIALEYRPDTAWWLTFGIGLLETEFEAFQSTSGDFSGFEFPEAPRTNAFIALNRAWASGWSISIDSRYTGSYFSTGRPGDRDNDRFDNLLIDDFIVTNLSVAFERGRYRWRAYVRNLFDRDYLTGLSFNGNEGFVGDERNAGLELEFTL